MNETIREIGVNQGAMATGSRLTSRKSRTAVWRFTDYRVRRHVQALPDRCESIFEKVRDLTKGRLNERGRLRGIDNSYLRHNFGGSNEWNGLLHL